MYKTREDFIKEYEYTTKDIDIVTSNTMTLGELHEHISMLLSNDIDPDTLINLSGGDGYGPFYCDIQVPIKRSAEDLERLVNDAMKYEDIKRRNDEETSRKFKELQDKQRKAEIEEYIRLRDKYKDTV